MADSLRLLSSMAARKPLAALCRRFAAEQGIDVRAEAAGGVEVAERLREGEHADVIVLASDSIDSLEAEAVLVKGGRVDLARSLIGIAVRAGAGRPVIGNAAELRAALTAARSIGYSTGPSGRHLRALIESWGLLPALGARLVLAPPGVPVARFVAEGGCELGFQQISELLGQPGIDLLGALPEDCQQATIFSGGVGQGTGQGAAARALLAFMAAPAADAAWRECGLEPARIQG